MSPISARCGRHVVLLALVSLGVFAAFIAGALPHTNRAAAGNHDVELLSLSDEGEFVEWPFEATTAAAAFHSLKVAWRLDPETRGWTAFIPDLGLSDFPVARGDVLWLVPPRPPPVAGAGAIIAVGDSVMLGSANALVGAIPEINVDAVVSRQFVAGTELLRQLGASGQLGGAVVVHLGTNGPMSAAQFDEMMFVLRKVPLVLFVSVRMPRDWETTVNTVLQAGVQLWVNAVLVDWHAASDAHPEYFTADGFHMNPTGAAAYAALIASRL